ncbi:hypothetical protein SAMN06265379_106145 [Saccharicrinis carchari]|uniref:N-acetyltransferase domain-containing protein n=1 Tax=Saccharicrinis carchari TaxID=1168039 RepID=A0A521DVL5_SACCC|nr:GNAT family N-acetyltransferase [Saccharicrinis carchari]SMO74900.1 hypothetical protein SAMN06265379_106145 [Saccharicrinis carchari]
MAKIKHEDNGKQGRFVIYEKDIFAGKMTYTWAGETQFIIEHTTVEAKFTGKGLGKQMVMEAVKFARKKKAKITARCSYAAKVLESDDSINDVRG